MKRLILLMIVIALMLPVRAAAAELSVFDKDIAGIEESIPEGSREAFSELGIASVSDLISKGIDLSSLLLYAGGLVQRYADTPFSVMLLLIIIIIMTAVAESYSFSLRYTDTREIMGVVVSLYLAAALISPISGLIDSSVKVIEGASAVMAVYLPVMVGMIAFSGRMMTSAGCYAATATASQLISQLSASVLAPLLKLFLSLSVSSGVCPRMKLSGVIEMTSKGFRWLLTFSMAVFTAVIGLNSALSNASDTVAGKAARFTLSSFVPIIGSAVADAYQTVQGSLGLLRSGAGVFVILSVAAAFAPLIVKAVLWSAALYIARLAQDALSVNSTARMLGALSAFMAALRAVLVAVMTAFIISSAAMLSVGGKT